MKRDPILKFLGHYFLLFLELIPMYLLHLMPWARTGVSPAVVAPLACRGKTIIVDAETHLRESGKSVTERAPRPLNPILYRNFVGALPRWV